MQHNVHFYTRLVARESKAARKALTEAAKQRHWSMADHYSRRAEVLRTGSGDLHHDDSSASQ